MSAAPREEALVSVEDPTVLGRAHLPQKRSRSSYGFWIVLLVLAGLIGWIVFSDNPAAQEVREDVTGAHEQTIVETPFPVKAHSFSYYEFTVPPGAVNVTVSGEFGASGDAVKSSGAKKDAGKADASKSNAAESNTAKSGDDDIEAYVLTTSAFAIWRDGYTTGSFYESGRGARGTINAALPSGAGSYCLVFNNNFSPRAGKMVHATVLLRYRAVLSESLLRLRERLWSWLGFN